MTTHIWKPDEIFVFGSNLLGIHGSGAARFARVNCGAEWGVGEGLTGQSYALPTCSEPGLPLRLEQIGPYAERFIAYATEHADQQFFLTRVGCGIAGFTDAQIAPLIRTAPANVRQPPEWRSDPRA